MTFFKTLAAILVAGLLSTAAQAQVGNNTDVINPNIADEDQLAGVAHLDDTLVAAIVDQRPLEDTLELDAILSQSLSEAQRVELYAELFIPINLNTASGIEILLIPGMSNRMAHEFDEYRPYTSLVQFRREIGKYVDEDEVARLEQYVFVPLDLNSASREDFAGIPGVGNRMVREFLEYRPYQSMEQFRREIGKYVDDDEVARLERYMTIR
jgi:DNA uptake protein ComE-like DNA-binding protein